jgi:thiol-disulfide isomerase/thioredoxin
MTNATKSRARNASKPNGVRPASGRKPPKPTEAHPGVGAPKPPKRAGTHPGVRARRGPRRRRMLLYAVPAVLIAVIAAVAAFASVGGRASTRARGAVTVRGPARTTLIPPGSPVPSFSAPALAGGRVNWSRYSGTPAVLALWAPWCPHCQKELPVLDSVALEFPNVRIVSIVTAVDQRPGPTPARFMSSHGLTFPVAMDSATGKLSRAFGLTSFPTVYYVDRRGIVRSSAVGERSEAQTREAMRAIAGS